MLQVPENQFGSYLFLCTSHKLVINILTKCLMISTSGQLIEFYIAKFILTILMKQNLSQTIIFTHDFDKLTQVEQKELLTPSIRDVEVLLPEHSAPSSPFHKYRQKVPPRQVRPRHSSPTAQQISHLPQVTGPLTEFKLSWEIVIQEEIESR